MKYTVLFLDVWGDRTLVCETNDEKEANKSIQNYIFSHSLSAAPFQRRWKIDNTIYIDFGSHSELFLIKEEEEEDVCSNNEMY